MLLPFLPMLAPQILLNNLLSDIPLTTIAGDNVDPKMVEKLHRWNTRFIGSYMVRFGLVSSVFDFLTFGMLLLVFRASPEEFRTGWFVESLNTELVIALVVRTRRLFFRSRPGRLLLPSTLIFVAIGLDIPYLPFMSLFGFVPLPALLMLAMLGLTVCIRPPRCLCSVALRYCRACRAGGSRNGHSTRSGGEYGARRSRDGPCERIKL